MYCEIQDFKGVNVMLDERETIRKLTERLIESFAVVESGAQTMAAAMAEMVKLKDNEESRARAMLSGLTAVMVSAAIKQETEALKRQLADFEAVWELSESMDKVSQQ